MRRTSVVTAACTSVLLIACQGVASPTSPSPTPAPSVISSQTLEPTLGTSASPSETKASGEILNGFGLNDILRVDVNRLAVRAAPYIDMPLATGWTLDGKSTGDVRLNIGDFVSVDLGGVKIDDTTWYRVFPAENGQFMYSTVWWDTKNNGANPVEPGWVAAAVGPDVYLTFHEAPQSEPWLAGLPLLVSGAGNYLSGPLQSTDLFTLNWAYLIDDQLAPCDFRVTLAAVGGGEEVVAVDASTIGAFEEGGVGLGNGDGTPIVGEGVDTFELRVASGCEWTLRLEPQPHD